MRCIRSHLYLSHLADTLIQSNVQLSQSPHTVPWLLAVNLSSSLALTQGMLAAHLLPFTLFIAPQIKPTITVHMPAHVRTHSSFTTPQLHTFLSSLLLYSYPSTGHVELFSVFLFSHFPTPSSSSFPFLPLLLFSSMSSSVSVYVSLYIPHLSLSHSHLFPLLSVIFPLRQTGSVSVHPPPSLPVCFSLHSTSGTSLSSQSC